MTQQIFEGLFHSNRLAHTLTSHAIIFIYLQYYYKKGDFDSASDFQSESNRLFGTYSNQPLIYY